MSTTAKTNSIIQSLLQERKELAVGFRAHCEQQADVIEKLQFDFKRSEKTVLLQQEEFKRREETMLLQYTEFQRREETMLLQHKEFKRRDETMLLRHEELEDSLALKELDTSRLEELVESLKETLLICEQELEDEKYKATLKKSPKILGKMQKNMHRKKWRPEDYKWDERFALIPSGSGFGSTNDDNTTPIKRLSPRISPRVSPRISPKVSPKVSPKTSTRISPKILPRKKSPKLPLHSHTTSSASSPCSPPPPPSSRLHHVRLAPPPYPHLPPHTTSSSSKNTRRRRCDQSPAPRISKVIQGILDRNEERRQALIEKDLVANVEDDLMRSKLNRLLRKDMILYNYEASVAEEGANKDMTVHRV